MPRPELNWSPCAAPPPLGSGGIHVWAFPIEPEPDELNRLAAHLSPEEMDRANQFRFPRLRERYIAGRGRLRLLLGRYLEFEPAQLRFDFTPRGKPLLSQSGIHFNLAHSNELALLAITKAAPVGVDLELIRPMPDGLEIARRFFAAGEVAGFDKVTANARDEAFFNLWTRKEAWLKATGDGISESLSKVELTFRAGEIPRVLAIDGDVSAAEEWSLHHLQPANGFVGALAIPCRDVRLNCWAITN